MRLVCSFAQSTSLLFPHFVDLPQAAQENKDQQTPPKTEVASLKQPLAFGLEDGTPIKLRLTRNLSSADATTGDRVDFEVLEDIKVKDVIVVPRGVLRAGRRDVRRWTAALRQCRGMDIAGIGVPVPSGYEWAGVLPVNAERIAVDLVPQ